MTIRAVAVAGAGIAGLTAGLSLAARGFSVTIFEKAARLEDVGAGLQLSPNATRILGPLGVLDRLGDDAVRPQAILLRDAGTLAPLARVPLGDLAERRWGAPYLVVHRADLQRALLACIREVPAITLHTGAEVRGAAFGPSGVSVEVGGSAERALDATLLVAADGVWSGLRPLVNNGRSRFTGHIAFRSVLRRYAAELDNVLGPDTVTAFLSPDFHLIAYPLRGGAEINLVAVTKGMALRQGWANTADSAHLQKVAGRNAPALSAVIRKAESWTAWPIHAIEGGGRWTRPGGLALIGDAAHALTPYAAQGAAMAIEDAALLAELASRETDTAAMLRSFERLRQPRVRRVARRGAFNRFVWHASGPVALARNLALRTRRPESLAADLDWLYGYDVREERIV